MKLNSIKLISGAALLTTLLVGCGQSPDTAAECGRVTVAQMGWQTADFMANVDRKIMTTGYGCTVELIQGNTMAILPPMIEKQQPDIAPEAWINTLRLQLEDAVRDEKLHYAGPAFQDGAIEGWYVPQHLLDAHPDIKTIDDALDHPELFSSPEHPGKGVVYNCPPGWGCNISMRQLFKAYDAENRGFVLAEVGSSAGLDSSVARAYERKQGWLGFYQEPQAYVAKYKLVRLDAGVPHNPTEWNNCSTDRNCKNPKKNDFDRAVVRTMITDHFAKRNLPVNDYIKVRGFSDSVLVDVLVFMDKNQASGEVAAEYFLKKYPEIWTKWVTPEAAQRIKEKL